MSPTRYSYFAGCGAALLLLAALVPAVGPLSAFVGTVYLLLAGYATLYGAHPTRAGLAATTVHRLVGSLLAGLTMVGVVSLPTVVVASTTPATAAMAGFTPALALAPLPAALALAASGRARDRRPYVLAAGGGAVAGPLVAVGVARWLGTPVVAGVPAYLAFRRRVPGVRDSYSSLDDLPLSRPTLVALLWLLVVVSGWGPVRVV